MLPSAADDDMTEFEAIIVGAWVIGAIVGLAAAAHVRNGGNRIVWVFMLVTVFVSVCIMALLL